MGRKVIALLIAPALVPLLMLGDLLNWANTENWFGVFFIITTAFAYAGVLLIGAPILLFLWARSYTALWITVLIGVVVSAITWIIFSLLFSLSLGHSLVAAFGYTFAGNMLKGLIWPAGACGVVVSTAIWIIVRPDHQHSGKLVA